MPTDIEVLTQSTLEVFRTFFMELLKYQRAQGMIANLGKDVQSSEGLLQRILSRVQDLPASFDEFFAGFVLLTEFSEQDRELLSSLATSLVNSIGIGVRSEPSDALKKRVVRVLQQSLGTLSHLSKEFKEAVYVYAQAIRGLEEYSERYLKAKEVDDQQRAARYRAMQELSREIRKSLYTYCTTSMVLSQNSSVVVDSLKKGLEAALATFERESQVHYDNARRVSGVMRDKADLLLGRTVLSFFAVMTTGVELVEHVLILRSSDRKIF